MQQIKVNDFIKAYSLENMGKMIDTGRYVQVGNLRTEYLFDHGRGRSIEAIVRCSKTDKLYAIEQHRGLAIMALIRDTEILENIAKYQKEYPDEKFVYDQEINQTTAEIPRERIEKVIAAMPEEAPVDGGKL